MKNPIHTRDDLLRLFAAVAPTEATMRAALAGSIEMLGMFARIEPDARPGLVAVITTPSGRRTTLAVVERPGARNGWVRRTVDRVPWESWLGEDAPTSLGWTLRGGDDPDTARECRQATLLLRAALERAEVRAPSQTTQESTQGAEDYQKKPERPVFLRRLLRTARRAR